MLFTAVLRDGPEPEVTITCRGLLCPMLHTLIQNVWVSLGNFDEPKFL